MVFTKLTFWKATAERAVRTAAQFVAVGWGVDQLDDRGVIRAFQLDFELALSLAGGGALAALLTSLMAIPVRGGPSFTKAELLRPPPAEAQARIDVKMRK